MKTSYEYTTPPDAFNGPFKYLKKEVKSLKRKQLCDKYAISLISKTIASVKDQVDSTLDDSRSTLKDLNQHSRSRLNRDNERNLIHDSIESSAKLICQLIAVNVSIHSDLSSIKRVMMMLKKSLPILKHVKTPL